jgi:hypothetical protein
VKYPKEILVKSEDLVVLPVLEGLLILQKINQKQMTILRGGKTD